jgi:hypothetical protein
MTHIEQLHLDAMIVKDLQAASKSAEITENIAIEFAQWIKTYCIVDWDVADRRVYIFDNKFFYGEKELFQEYLKTKENDKSK